MHPSNISKKVTESFERSIMLRGTHDNWEKLVGAVLDREELRRLAYCESFSSSASSDFGSRFSFDSAALDPVSSLGAKPIKFKEVKKATKNFDREMLVDPGVLGPVFKGWIDEHTLHASNSKTGMAVAVKKWIKGSIEQQVYLVGVFPFQMLLTQILSAITSCFLQKEINYLSQIRHPNLVNLIGYCSKEDSLILVYEFMSQGSLDKHLFRGGNQSLSWATRIKVAIGVARALSFLHNMETPIIHRGCKCGNILLDSEFNAKLSNFSVARYGASGRMTHVSTGSRITEKPDVYSFGNILLELLSGSPALALMWPIEDQLEWVNRYVGDESNLLQIMDSRLNGIYPRDEACTVAKLACRCLNSNPDKRPRMAEVLATLQQLQLRF